jgi:hypothetical protein
MSAWTIFTHSANEQKVFFPFTQKFSFPSSARWNQDIIDHRGDKMVHRKLNRTHSHRQATIRNLVSNLLKHESIITTHAKAKEAQSAADKLITLAKTRSPNLDAAKVRAQKFIYVSSVCCR